MMRVFRDGAKVRSEEVCRSGQQALTHYAHLITTLLNTF